MTRRPEAGAVEVATYVTEDILRVELDPATGRITGAELALLSHVESDASATHVVCDPATASPERRAAQDAVAEIHTRLLDISMAARRARAAREERGDPMTEYADLEIGLHAREGITWRAELRFSQPRTDADIRLDSKGPVVTMDPDALRMLAEDEEEYGKALGKAVLDGPVGEGFRHAKAAAQSQGITMRVRLLIGPSASRLHGLHWETLRDPMTVLRC